MDLDVCDESRPIRVVELKSTGPATGETFSVHPQLVQHTIGWAPSFRLAPSSFESLAWLWALFGPGHACKGSRSELLQQKRARTIAWLARGERWVTDAGRNPKALGPVARYDSCPTVAYGISRRPVSKRFCSTSASNGEPTNRTKSPSITA